MQASEKKKSLINLIIIHINNMARYIGPKTKIARKFRDPIFGPDKYYEKKNYPPGMHGQTKRGQSFGIWHPADGEAESQIYLWNP